MGTLALIGVSLLGLYVAFLFARLLMSIGSDIEAIESDLKWSRAFLLKQDEMIRAKAIESAPVER